MASFFISHASQDLRTAEDLAEQLQGWGFASFFLDAHPDAGITVGRAWEDELYQQLRTADGLILLGSPSSAASRWCFAELALARASRKPIFPLWLGGSGREELLADVQWLDVSSDGTAYERLRRALTERFDARVALTWDARRAPYPGLKPFQGEDAAVFFARQDKVAEVLDHLAPDLRRGRFVAVIGSSGTGKSSLVRAGVVPQLQRGQANYAVIPPFTAGERPISSMARALAEVLTQRGVSADRAELQRRLELDPGELGELVSDLGTSASGARRQVVLVLDQAEELITLASAEQRAPFVAMLRTALHAGALSVLATLRTQFLEDSTPDLAFADLIDSSVLLAPLDRSRLPEVIEGPAAKVGITFASGLVARMVEETRGGDALPLLAYTLQQLYESGAAADRLITHEEYAAVGGVEGALRRRADAVAADLDRQGLSDLVLPTLLRLATVDDEGRPGRRPVPVGHLDEPERQIVDAFVDARLLTNDGQTVEVAHEALLRVWPPLHGAIADSQNRLRAQATVTRRAREWKEAGEQDGYLLHRDQLQAFRGLLGDDPPLRADEHEYYAASVALERRTHRAERSRRRLAVGVLGLVLVVVSVAGAVSFVQYRRASHQASVADSRALAAQALVALDDKPDLGMLLSLEAWNVSPTAQARSAALTAVQRSEGIEATLRNPNDGEIYATDHSPVEPLLAVGGQDRAIRLWDLSTRRVRGRPLVLPGDLGLEAEVLGLLFSPTGRDLAAVYTGGLTVVWRLQDDGESQPTLLDPLVDETVAVTFSPSGALLAGTGFDNQIGIWDIRTGRPAGAAFGLAQSEELDKTTIVFTSEDTIVGFSENGTLAQWDVSTGTARSSAALETGRVYRAALSRDGRLLAVLAAADPTDATELSLWDTTTSARLAVTDAESLNVNTDLVFDPRGKQLAAVDSEEHVALFDTNAWSDDPVTMPLNGAATVSFTPDGEHVVVGGRGFTTLWNGEHPRPFRTVVSGEPELEESVAEGDLTPLVAFDGPSRLVSVADGALQSWNVSATAVPQDEIRVTTYLNSVNASADGRTIAFANYDDVVSTWRRGEGSSRPLFDAEANAVAVSADGTMIATGGHADDGRVRLWDAETGTEWGREVHRDEEVVWTLSFHPDGSLLASAGYGQVISLWPIESGEDGMRSLQPGQDLVGHTGAVNDVAFDPTGRRLASAANDRTVRLWDVDRAESLGPPLSTQATPEAVAFSPDGATLVAVQSDGTMQFWDTASGLALGPPISGGRNSLMDVAFSPDGRRLATVDYGGAVVLWEPSLWANDIDSVAETLCDAASRNLTRREWRELIPQRDYERTCERWQDD